MSMKRRVKIEDQGGRIPLEPSPDDPIAAAEDSLAEEFGALDLTRLRREARDDERVAGRRRYSTPTP
jgi:hypothetical protein